MLLLLDLRASGRRGTPWHLLQARGARAGRQLQAGAPRPVAWLGRPTGRRAGLAEAQMATDDRSL
eukprot:5738512-Heterocapsa_arctica.AAC.1